MNCSKCKNSALENVEYAGLTYCKKHFVELIEKRIRKNLRTGKLIDIKKDYALILDDSSESKLTEHFLKEIFDERLKIKRIDARNFKIEEINLPPERIIKSTNLDEQVLLFLNTFTKNENSQKTKNILPLEVVMQKEIGLLCEIIGIPFYPRVKEDILLDLDRKYPGTKFSLFQSKRNIDL